MQVEVEETSLPPQTTRQEDLTTAGQRKVNLIWEFTQSSVAIMIIGANMVVAVAQGLGLTKNHEYPIILSSSLFLVIGFYFSRTNHAAIGGIGPKASSKYVGR